MAKIHKIVEARNLVADKASRIEKGLARLLSDKELKALQPELGYVLQACRMLQVKLVGLDPPLKGRLSNVPESGTK